MAFWRLSVCRCSCCEHVPRGGVGSAQVGAAWGQAESPRLGGSTGGGLGGLTPSPQELPSGPPHLSVNPTLDPKGHCDFRGCHSRRLSRATLLVIPLTCTKAVSDSPALGILSDTGWMEFDSTRRCRPPGHPPPPLPIASRAGSPAARASAPALLFTHCGRRHPWRPSPKFRAEGPPHGTVRGQRPTETHPSVTPESPRLAHLAARGHMCVIDLRAEFGLRPESGTSSKRERGCWGGRKGTPQGRLGRGVLVCLGWDRNSEDVVDVPGQGWEDRAPRRPLVGDDACFCLCPHVVGGGGVSRGPCYKGINPIF